MADLFSSAIVAFAGGGQTSATQLGYGTNRIATVATLGDSVKLPTAVAGQECTVINDGAQPCRVFGAGSDTVNGIATATGISQAPGTTVIYRCAIGQVNTATPTITVAGNWETGTAGIGTGKLSPIAIAASGAFDPHTSATYVINNASATAMTIVAPTAGTDDGVTITITADTATARTVTGTGNLLDTGSANVLTATFAAFKGAGLTIMAFNGRWKVLFSVGVTFS